MVMRRRSRKGKRSYNRISLQYVNNTYAFLYVARMLSPNTFRYFTGSLHKSRDEDDNDDEGEDEL